MVWKQVVQYYAVHDWNKFEVIWCIYGVLLDFITSVVLGDKNVHKVLQRATFSHTAVKHLGSLMCGVKQRS